MPAKNSNKKIIKPLSFCNLDELSYVLDRLPNPLPPRLHELFVVDTLNETYFLLDIAKLSKKAAKNHTLLFETSKSHSASTLHTISEIRKVYHVKDTNLLGQLRFNRLVAQALETIGEHPSPENLSKMKDALTCSISHRPYIFPMLTPYGQTYEHGSMASYFQGLSIQKDPLTQQPFSIAQLIPNKAAQQLVQLIYQHVNIEQKNARIDDLKAAKEEIFGKLAKLPINLVASSKETILEEKKKLIKRRDRFLVFTYSPIVFIGISLLVTLGIVPPFAHYFLLAPENKISTSPRTVRELEKGLQAARNRVVIFLGLMLTIVIITFSLSGAVSSYLRRRERSLNEQIVQLSDWINDSESRQQRIEALDAEIKTLNKSLESQKSSGKTEFFRNPRKRETNSSSELAPAPRMAPGFLRSAYD